MTKLNNEAYKFGTMRLPMDSINVFNGCELACYLLKRRITSFMLVWCFRLSQTIWMRMWKMESENHHNSINAKEIANLFTATANYAHFVMKLNPFRFAYNPFLPSESCKFAANSTRMPAYHTAITLRTSIFEVHLHNDSSACSFVFFFFRSLFHCCIIILLESYLHGIGFQESDDGAFNIKWTLPRARG